MTQNTLFVNQRLKTLYVMEFLWIIIKEQKKNIKNALGEEILARQLKIAERQAIVVGLN